MPLVAKTLRMGVGNCGKRPNLSDSVLCQYSPKTPVELSDEGREATLASQMRRIRNEGSIPFTHSIYNQRLTKQ
jgi:hypothetical protein